ncbi:MAG: glycosyltransferase [Cyclobacteriaceae bacterium]
MAHIVFIMFSENSAYRGSLGAARVLKQSGHKVTYLGIAQYRELVEQNGLQFQAFGYDQELEASLQKENEAQIDQAQKKMKFLKPLRLIRLRMKLDECTHQQLERKMKEDLATWIDQVIPDLVFLDQLFMWGYALPLLQSRVPVAGINCILSDAATPGLPPVTTSYIPKAHPTEPDIKRAKKEWNRLYRKRLWDYWFSDGRTLRKKIAATGTGLRWQEFGYKLDIPEIVLFPPEFEFSSKGNNPSRSYVGAFTGHMHSTSGDHQDLLSDDHRRLIYMSFGNIVTGEHYAGDREKLYTSFMTYLANKPQLQGIMQVSDPEEAEQYRIQCPDNVRVESRVPQIEVLKKASLFISHCGCSSVREAMHFGVPVLGLPFALDQPGNAARLQYHGAGLIADPSELTEGRLSRMIDRMLDDPAFAENARKLQKAFDRLENTLKLTRFVSKYMKTEKSENAPIRS